MRLVSLPMRTRTRAACGLYTVPFTSFEPTSRRMVSDACGANGAGITGHGMPSSTHNVAIMVVVSVDQVASRARWSLPALNVVSHITHHIADPRASAKFRVGASPLMRLWYKRVSPLVPVVLAAHLPAGHDPARIRTVSPSRMPSYRPALETSRTRDDSPEHLRSYSSSSPLDASSGSPRDPAGLSSRDSSAGRVGAVSRGVHGR